MTLEILNGSSSTLTSADLLKSSIDELTIGSDKSFEKIFGLLSITFGNIGEQ